MCTMYNVYNVQCVQCTLYNVYITLLELEADHVMVYINVAVFSYIYTYVIYN